MRDLGSVSTARVSRLSRPEWGDRLEHVNDLPPDVSRLRVLETWLQITLARVREQIAEVERRAAQREQVLPPPPPDWVVQLGVGGDGKPVAVHVGGCRGAGRRTRSVSRDEVMRALAEGVEACALCRPDTELGIF
ncbi:DUF6233 domain-containing protein [Streptomyces lydicus]|uniref:DUF6233 domain-containing protein n=1 Tax=Streptomyces lydicus TaxID=47763 RepID=UPI0037A3E0F9